MQQTEDVVDDGSTSDEDNERGGTNVNYRSRTRRKATERPVGADARRQAFSKRKRGIVLKAYQLYKLTDAKVFLFMANDKNSTWAYASPGFGGSLHPALLRKMRELARIPNHEINTTDPMPHPKLDQYDRAVDDRHLYVGSTEPALRGGATTNHLSDISKMTNAASAKDSSTVIQLTGNTAQFSMDKIQLPQLPQLPLPAPYNALLAAVQNAALAKLPVVIPNVDTETGAARNGSKSELQVLSASDPEPDATHPDNDANRTSKGAKRRRTSTDAAQDVSGMQGVSGLQATAPNPQLPALPIQLVMKPSLTTRLEQNGDAQPTGQNVHYQLDLQPDVFDAEQHWEQQPLHGHEKQQGHREEVTHQQNGFYFAHDAPQAMTHVHAQREHQMQRPFVGHGVARQPEYGVHMHDRMPCSHVHPGSQFVVETFVGMPYDHRQQQQYQQSMQYDGQAAEGQAERGGDEAEVFPQEAYPHNQNDIAACDDMVDGSMPEQDHEALLDEAGSGHMQVDTHTDGMNAYQDDAAGLFQGNSIAERTAPGHLQPGQQQAARAEQGVVTCKDTGAGAVDPDNAGVANRQEPDKYVPAPDRNRQGNVVGQERVDMTFQVMNGDGSIANQDIAYGRAMSAAEKIEPSGNDADTAQQAGMLSGAAEQILKQLASMSRTAQQDSGTPQKAVEHSKGPAAAALAAARAATLKQGVLKQAIVQASSSIDMSQPTGNMVPTARPQQVPMSKQLAPVNTGMRVMQDVKARSTSSRPPSHSSPSSVPVSAMEVQGLDSSQQLLQQRESIPVPAGACFDDDPLQAADSMHADGMIAQHRPSMEMSRSAAMRSAQMKPALVPPNLECGQSWTDDHGRRFRVVEDVDPDYVAPQPHAPRNQSLSRHQYDGDGGSRMSQSPARGQPRQKTMLPNSAGGMPAPVRMQSMQQQATMRYGQNAGGVHLARSAVPHHQQVVAALYMDANGQPDDVEYQDDCYGSEYDGYTTVEYHNPDGSVAYTEMVPAEMAPRVVQRPAIHAVPAGARVVYGPNGPMYVPRERQYMHTQPQLRRMQPSDDYNMVYEEELQDQVADDEDMEDMQPVQYMMPSHQPQHYPHAVPLMAGMPRATQMQGKVIHKVGQAGMQYQQAAGVRKAAGGQPAAVPQQAPPSHKQAHGVRLRVAAAPGTAAAFTQSNMGQPAQGVHGNAQSGAAFMQTGGWPTRSATNGAARGGSGSGLAQQHAPITAVQSKTSNSSSMNTLHL